VDLGSGVWARVRALHCGGNRQKAIFDGGDFCFLELKIAVSVWKLMLYGVKIKVIHSIHMDSQCPTPPFRMGA
jgi:hypothetical protein